MPNGSRVRPLTLEVATATTNAGNWPLGGGLEINLQGICLGGMAKNFITIYSNGGNDAGHTGILNPMSPIFDQEPGQVTMKAYGFRNFEKYRLRVIAACG